MKLNRHDIRRLIFEVLNESPQQSEFNLKGEVKNKIMKDHLARIYNVPVDSLESEDFKDKFGHYDWNDKFLKYGRDINTEGGDIPVMWIVNIPSSLSMPDTDHVGKDEINAIISAMNKTGGTVDPERTGYELAVSSTHRIRVKGSSPKKHLNVIYLKKV